MDINQFLLIEERVNILLYDKGWRYKAVMKTKNFKSVMIEVLKRIDSDLEINAIFDMLHHYSWYDDSTDYSRLLFLAFNNIESKLVDTSKINRIVFTPLYELNVGFASVKKRKAIGNFDYSEAKSGSALLYDLKANMYYFTKEFNFLKGKKYLYIDEFENYKKFQKAEGDLVICIDDFVGTGDTLLSYSKHINNIDYYVSLVCLQEGVANLNKQNITNFLFGEIQEKVENYFTDQQSKDNIRLIISNISHKLNVKKDIYGYKNCAALVSMKRTPNNTIKFFWDKIGINGSTSQIFPR